MQAAQEHGYRGSDRTVRSAVARAKRAYRKQNRRIFRPWVTEPGHWAQFDWADGPVIDGRKTYLFCSWLAWSRYRVVLAANDRKQPSLIGCLAEAMAIFGGAPSHWLTDNQKAVTPGRIANLPVKHPELARLARHYGTTLELCMPQDPQTKGGSEATVKLAKADLLPSDLNLRPEYRSFGELLDASDRFTREVNARAHRVTGRAPIEMLAEERRCLHPLPRTPFAAALGKQRTVDPGDGTIAWDSSWYSVPSDLAGEKVLVREQGDQLIVTANGANDGWREVARHRLAGRGVRVIDERHYDSDPPPGALTVSPNRRTRCRRSSSGSAPTPGAGSRPPATPARQGSGISCPRSSNWRDWRAGRTLTPPWPWPGNASASASATSPPSWSPTRRADCTVRPRTPSPAGDPYGLEELRRQRGAGRMKPSHALDGIAGQLRTLRLPYMRKAAPELLKTARSQRWDPAEALAALLREEIEGRSRSSRALRPKAANLPAGKTFQTWDEDLSSIPLPTQRSLKTLEWIERRENVVACGPAGTGKSHFLEALAHLAIERGYKASWFSLEELGRLIKRSRADDSALKAVQRVLKADLIVIDDIGLLPIDDETAEGFFRVIDAAYERRSIALSSNLHPSRFDEIMPASLANAAVDRLLHHAHPVDTQGDSIRVSQALAGKGVAPLNG